MTTQIHTRTTCPRCHGAGVIEEWQDAPAPAAPPMPREWAEPQIAAFLGHVRAGTIGPYPDDAATARAIADHLWNNWAQIAEARALLGRA